MEELVIRPSMKFIKLGYAAVILLVAASIVDRLKFEIPREFGNPRVHMQRPARGLCDGKRSGGRNGERRAAMYARG